MTKGLFALAACLMFVSSASAQRVVEFRRGDALRGPVRSVRAERAEVSVQDGTPVEGPRHLVFVRNYSPNGKTAEDESYSPDGSVRGKTVRVYDDDGELIEVSGYDAKGELLDKKTYVRQGDEELTFGGDGRLQKRVVRDWNEKRDAIVEIRTYDGNGALTSRQVNTRDAANKKSTWETIDASGKLTERNVFSLDYGGPHRAEQTRFNPDGSIAGSRTATSDAAVGELGAVETDAEGQPRRRTHETREYDARRNLVKQTNYRWNTQTGNFEPWFVDYKEITYYR